WPGLNKDAPKKRHRLWWCFSCLVLLKIFSDIYYLRESFTPHLSIHSLEI
ncbi:phospholipase, partial [Escherichia coli]|nr:patatin-like phospholipase family protein [Escherichia coli]MQM55892.1 patatin-like phospholipase family protein [Escherichia coli]MQM66712.1 patatin-like phospholipase family protein [Escherichia coli]NNQ91751.1 patatin-like phospholipase family protein [Escherichia coli]NNR69912.1 patatin-like phospholipase family protein [Escherichia coli]